MSINNNKEKVRDGYFNELPSDIQAKLIKINKLIKDHIEEKLENEEHYFDLKDSRWAMSCIDEFKVVPSAKGEVGSVRVFQKGKEYRCMIQITGHFRNHQYGWIEELLHEFIKDTWQEIRPVVRRKFDMKLVCEGDMGNPDEGFDIYLNKNLSKMMWDKFEDKKTKVMRESVNDDEDGVPLEDLVEGKIAFNELPIGLYETLKSLSEVYDNNDFQYETVVDLKGKDFDSYTVLTEITNLDENEMVNIFNEMKEKIKNDPTKKLVITEEEDQRRFLMLEYTLDYARLLYKNALNNRKNNSITEAAEDNISNTEMKPSEAKRVLGTLSAEIIANADNPKHKVTQYTANIYANIITKNLLAAWGSSYKKLSITLDSYKSYPVFEFKVPNLSQDFIARYINGREPLNAFLHRIPEIKIKMSPTIFHTMKNRDDAYNFFKAAVTYYDRNIEKYSASLTKELMRMNTSMKNLVSTTNLSGLVVYPMKLLFVFDNVNMSNKNTFKIPKEDIDTINQFVKNIYSRYSAPEKEKKKIVEDIRKLIKEMQERTDTAGLKGFDEAVKDFLFGKYDNKLKEFIERFHDEQVDYQDMRTNSNYNLSYMREKFGVKKLKRIPADIVAYVTIQGENIKDANDKYMIASYCISKIEIVEWYIELLDTGNPKYVVPHTKPYLVQMRTALLAAYKKIMEVKITPPSQRPVIDIQYPKGFEG